MAMAQRWVGLLRQSLRLTTTQRTLSTTPSPPAAKRRKKKNLFDVVQFLPDWGIGYKIAKTTWRDVSYQITKINLYKDGRHGKAWGIRYKAGLQVADTPMRIGGVNKRGWKYINESQKKVEDYPQEEEKLAA